MKFRERPERRSAFVLVAVLIVISILSYSAYEFAHWVEIETETAIVQGREAQTRYLAESGLAYIEAIERLRRSGAEVPPLDNNADLFREIGVSLAPIDANSETTSTEEDSAGRFSVRSSKGKGAGERRGGVSEGESEPRYGVESEGARIHLNAWWQRDPAALEVALLSLPGSSKELTQAVLDWLDGDDSKREGGAEREDYEKMDPPLSPRNGLVESIDELLLVKGMTAAIFFGEDANRNGVLDPQENDGDRSAPMDDEDGELDPGWCDYLTLWSSEPNFDRKGRPRVWLNDSDLGRLYTLVEKEFGIEWAQFVVSARVVGGPGMWRHPTSPELGPFHFASLTDLIDARVTGEFEKKQINRESPLRSTSAEFGDDLNRVFDRWTVEWEPASAGRLDLTTAREESLTVLTPLSEEDRKKIVESRPAIGLPRELTSATSSADATEPKGTHAWLIASGILPKEKVRSIERSCGSTSWVVRMELVGWMSGDRQQHRLEVVLDTASVPPRVRSLARMDRWGSVNSLQQGDSSSEAKELPTLGEDSTSPSPLSSQEAGNGADASR
jgi:hypothetical protein